MMVPIIKAAVGARNFQWIDLRNLRKMDMIRAFLSAQ
jgi:hypothetical protein